MKDGLRCGTGFGSKQGDEEPPLVRQGSDCLVGAAVFHHSHHTINIFAGGWAGFRHNYQKHTKQRSHAPTRRKRRPVSTFVV